MKRWFFVWLCIVFWLCAVQLNAQADISMATHWNNRAGYNPASISRPGYLYIFSNVRQQWAGAVGAPKVLNLQISQFSSNLNSGFGLSFVSDNIGFTQALNPMLTYAYQILDKNENTWSFGLSGGFFARTLNGTLYDPEIISDPNLIFEKVNYIRPDANFGIEFQSMHFIAGLSSTHLFSVGNDSLFLNSNHRYGYVIYKNDNSELLNYQVGVQVVNRTSLVVMEINAGVRFKNPNGLTKGPKEIFDLGLTYRTTQQLTFLFGVLLSPDFRLGYGYDYSFIPGYTTNGTHEIMLEYRIPVKELNCKTCPSDNYWYK